MATPPQLTPEQRTAALAKAAEARAARAEIKARLKMGSMSLRDALDSKDPNVGKLKVVSMLESLPGVGKVKARKVMDGYRHRRQPARAGPRRAAACRPCSSHGVWLSEPLIIVVSGPGASARARSSTRLSRATPRSG